MADIDIDRKAVEAAAYGLRWGTEHGFYGEPLARVALKHALATGTIVTRDAFDTVVANWKAKAGLASRQRAACQVQEDAYRSRVQAVLTELAVEQPDLAQRLAGAVGVLLHLHEKEPAS